MPVRTTIGTSFAASCDRTNVSSPWLSGGRQIQQHRIEPYFSQALKPYRKPARLGDLKPAGAAFFQIFLQQPDIAGIVFNKWNSHTSDSHGMALPILR
jgi:hypothetical protein